MRIAVVTAFSSFIEHYSLTGIVQDQLEMIHRAGHIPVLVTLSDFQRNDSGLPDYVEHRPVLPTFQKIDYRSVTEITPDHGAISIQSFAAITEELSDVDAFLTHDLMFTGWNLPVALAIQGAAKAMTAPWLHWVHSVPSGRRDWWGLSENSKMVYPNHTDRVRCAEAFGTWSENVLVIPHSKDPRRYLFRTELADRIATDYHLMEADFIQTIPVSIDRVEHKGLDQIMDIFAAIKRLGNSVRLIVCNAWCNTPEHRETVSLIQERGSKLGLTDRDLIFTSLVEGEAHELGVSQQVVADLMSISNLFIYPTKSESFGLVVAEAALCGQLLVLNASLPMMADVAGFENALYFNFGSHQQQAINDNWGKFYSDIAKIILHRFNENESLRAKTAFRKNYCWERVWGITEDAILTEIATSSRVGVALDPMPG
jgi:glycosyltransferase involved in cell wall biosynthesis